MILYHIQRECDFTPLYYPVSEFIVGEDYNRLHKNSFDHDGTYIESTEVRDGKEYNHKRNVIELLDWDKILDMTSVEQLNLVNLMKGITHNDRLDLREYILENIRLQYYPDRPSRFKCIWLTDEESLDRWYKIIDRHNAGFSIYEMDVEGNVFKSADHLLPQPCWSNGLIEEVAHKYWNPKESDLTKNDREYLFEGRARVIKKVK